MSIRIRSARAEDLETIVSFQIEMAKLTEAKALSRERVTQGVQAVLEDKDRGFYLVAELKGRVAGSLLVTREWSDWRAGWFWWIQSVFVSASARRQGLYRALHSEVRTLAAKTPNVVGLRLYVECENKRAMEVYRRMGMEETSYRLYEDLL